MVGGVPHAIRDDGCEGVDPPELIVGDLHEDWKERLPDREEIVIGGLFLEGGEGIPCLFKEEGDRVGRHAELGGFFGSRARAVEDRDDDNQRECVGSGKLGDFGAFREPAEPVRSGDGNGGLRGY
jgi:hypothetical protein